jgi:signal transduction histidine kinase
VLQLEREAGAALSRAETEERSRSALWRMDLALARLAAEESARAPERWLEAGPRRGGDVVGRFELASTGELKSTGAPLATGEVSWDGLLAAAGLLAKVRADAVVASNDLNQRGDRAVAEFNLRNRYAQQNFAFPGQAPAAADNAAPLPEVMAPAWTGDRLMLVRRIDLAGRQVLQGSLLDWPAVRARLLADVADLLPRADLVPVRRQDAERTRMLASLPARLVPGEVPTIPVSGTSAGLVVALAWVALALSLSGIGALVAGTAALSERRAAFVSAVSHELRTPLTTFRMYAEMLEAGMVPAERQAGYLHTLRVEAERLGRLVENVLAYARVERGRLPRAPSPIALDEALGRIVPRLCERASAAGMELLAPPLSGIAVIAEPTTLEQVLFNLVENAAKYAAASADKRIHLEVARAGARVRLAVRDHGPGVAADVKGRLFTPFAKSAQQAADSAPGVGLGLALSRRLARTMGGDLVFEVPDGGACFVVLLRAAVTSL